MRACPQTIGAKYRAAVRELETILSPDGLDRGIVSDRDIARARTQIRNYLGGGLIVTETEKEIRFETEASTEEMLLRLTGSGSQAFMVAGAGFGTLQLVFDLAA